MTKASGRHRSAASTGATRSGLWAVADQAVASGSNVLLALLIARSSSATEFGAYSLAFAGYAIAVGFSRAIGANTFMLRYATASRDEQRSHYGNLTGVGLALAGAASVVMLLASVSGSEATSYFVYMAILMPGLVVQDDWRQAMFAARDSRAAFGCDLIWLCVEVPLFIAVPYVSDRPQAYLVAWGIGAWVATSVFAARFRALPSPRGGLRFARRNKAWLPGLLGEYLAVTGGGLLLPYGIAAVLGLSAAGGLRAGQIVFGIAATALMGLVPVVMAYCVRAYESGGLEGARRLGRTFTVLGCGWMAAFAVVVHLIPGSAGTTLAGASWTAARSIISPLGVVYVFQWASTVNLTVLRATGRVERTALVRTMMTLLLLGASLTGAWAGNLIGAAWGMASAAVAGALLSTVALGREGKFRRPPRAVLADLDADTMRP